MWAGAHDYVRRYRVDAPIRVIEFGGRDINGSVRGLFPGADYWSIDLVDGPGVDEVADARTWSGGVADLIICCETFEHTPHWRDIVTNAARHIRGSGRVVFTCAGPGWPEHSADDGGPLHDGEFYANVTPDDLRASMAASGLVDIDIELLGCHLRATGVIRP